MTEEELFKVYIKRELCVHCRFPQFCKGEKDCSDIATAKRHYLAGVEAGKSQAETDLAIVAYMQGAESGYNKANEWHYVKDGDLPKNNTTVLVILKNKRVKISTFMENKFTIWNNDYDAYTKLYDVIAWKEITLPALPKECE